MNHLPSASEFVGGTRPNNRPTGRRQYDPTALSGRSAAGYSQAEQQPLSEESLIKVSGMLEMLPDFGILRQKDGQDTYISQSQIRRFSLRVGDFVEGLARPPKDTERYMSLIRVEKVEGLDPDQAHDRPHFDKLTPVFPNVKIKLETKKEIFSTRLIDLVAPIGKGQRGMVVSPPKSGKTTILKDIARGVTENNPEMSLFVALIGERPEEVTDIARSVKGEVFASNFDESAEAQTRVAELCLERAKRLSEVGKDVVILLDSITRLARAYNMVVPPSGRTLSGGFDPSALYPSKHFFGAARNFDPSAGSGQAGSGSLTIIATALVDTGSRMDDLIFEEFKGTGNMELRLDRRLAERRVFPAIDIQASGTRHEELLFTPKELEKIYLLRRMVDLSEGDDITGRILERLSKNDTNEEFLRTLHETK